MIYCVLRIPYRVFRIACSAIRLRHAEHAARPMSQERIFSEAELRQYDGTKGQPVYIACEGVVYDVSDAPLWRTGLHQNLHYAGLDLTRSLRKAPHGREVFGRTYIRIVGRLKLER